MNPKSFERALRLGDRVGRNPRLSELQKTMSGPRMLVGQARRGYGDRLWSLERLVHLDGREVAVSYSSPQMEGAVIAGPGLLGARRQCR